ncbi:hypothetical protein OW763_09910 [Clostridium aestuarii]|uniref:Glucose/Sorbosone dehydrogenase domain-containing protein n=1 Tax=Clostridium aestuarii TaxID=338193 RepID=A0ABT4D087_9CLOT|nr:hypothetical protein [Clostridium aestuarii]MCY6484654.1 hypothetical protein [Clostridium aestuarii]
MKRFLKSVLIIIIFTFGIISLKKYCIKDYNISLKDNNLQWKLKYKGMKGAVDFTIDDNENYYIGYKDKIQFIDKNGKSFGVFSNNNMNINSIEYYKGKLYFSSNSCIYSYELHSKECIEIISDLPNFGDFKNSLLKINGEYLYVTIGSATNSGVVGSDNKWIKKNPFGHDISPEKITLRGINFEDGKTGAFVNYRTKNIEGQIIPGHFPGNASIIMYNLKTGDSATFAWGIRNVKGLDFDSRGRMIASVGGMEDRGLRPVKGDTDYIFVIKTKQWYGWPDYSGGDPISSPKFKGQNNKIISFILDNHPTTNPEAPIYVHKNLGTLKGLSVDSKGSIGKVDSIYFFDNHEKKLCCIDDKGVLSEKLKFDEKSQICSIKYVKNQILIMDANEGNLYSLSIKEKDTTSNLYKPMICFILVMIVIVIIAILKLNMDNWNKLNKK